MIETFRSVVHTWEIDAVDHFTTEMYFKSFGAADWHLLSRLGYDLAAIKALRPGHGRSRFMKELSVNDAYHIESGVIAKETGSFTIGHRLFDSETGTLCATHRLAWRGDIKPVASGFAMEWSEPDVANRVDVGRLKSWTATTCTMVRSEDLDPAGRMTLSALIHNASNANVQFQNILGMTGSYTRANKIGFSTAEYHIEIHDLPERVGAMVAVDSAVAHVGRTSLFNAHRMVEKLSGAPIATVIQFGVHLDRVARRPAELPAAIRDKARSLLSAG